MFKLVIGGIAAVSLASMAIGSANAARWCVDQNCNFASRAACERAADRSGSDCERYSGGGAQRSRVDSPRQIEPSRPYGANRNQCYFDDGYGRFRPCDQGSGGRS
ncbi:hypothetical protein GJW-30_1_04419 [Variibacter gotjawalensis]|uniref:DUF3551 domain-containing protein n=1 Tax=Variibacter gotjawalensis TaxID=1333996 RepID=A0A0S3Q119_9BRAD|nr:hypothetical protein [Variibacter gotjawalensis]RZS49594.1 hypothetical protein EV661_2030 [Variibacter gotjawalensis]BAT61857.1 hypothetical protein GJW-30_1_04419 [Variibacter gotjawalensis]